MTQNIRKRRGRNVDIRVPMFQDEKTVLEMDTGKPPEIHMDCQAFGMGCCCLQVTFQARDVHESRHLYDQLAVLAPVALALTAASPIYKGCLSEAPPGPSPHPPSGRRAPQPPGAGRWMCGGT
jgi:glutamate--cysteine ligase catalytic subunit